MTNKNDFANKNQKNKKINNYFSPLYDDPPIK